MEKAFKAEYGLSNKEDLDLEAQLVVTQLTELVLHAVIAKAVKGEQLEIELIQDAVETSLMDAGYYAIARRYIVYREERHRTRRMREDSPMEPTGQRPETPAKLKESEP